MPKTLLIWYRVNQLVRVTNIFSSRTLSLKHRCEVKECFIKRNMCKSHKYYFKQQ